MEQIAALPASLARLTGKEADEVRRYRDQADTFTERVLFPGTGLASGARDPAGDRTRRSHRTAPSWWRGAGRRTTCAGSNRISMQRAANAGPPGESLPRPCRPSAARTSTRSSFTLSEHRELFDFLRSSQAHGTRAGAIRERLRLIESIDVPEGAEQRLATYREAMEALRSWLRVPEPDGLVRRVRNRWPWFSACSRAGAGRCWTGRPWPVPVHELHRLHSWAIPPRACRPDSAVPFRTASGARRRSGVVHAA